MPSIKRLIIKRFGGTSNFILFLLLTLVTYLFLKNYIFETDYDENIIDGQLADGLKIADQPSINIDADKKPENNVKINQIINIKQEIAKDGPKYVINHGTPDPECVIDEKCSGDTVPYKLISGEGLDKYPTICFNGKLLVSKNLKENKIGRGINMLVLDKDTLEVKSNENYDTFTDDARFFRFSKTSINDGDIILMASFDEMANSLRESSIKLMENYGSQLFGNIKFRDSFVMIGQRGIAKGKAIEFVEAKNKKDFASAAKITGCATLPLGVISPVKFNEMHVNSEEQIVVGNYIKNCGLKEECKPDEFAVHIYSGKNDKDEPKICVDGRYVIAKGINDAGRGINIVVVGNGKDIIKTAHFDTYAEDSTNLEIFLEGLYDNVILIAVTFDEASTKLGSLARNLFFDLGSGLIQNLRHRDSWYLIGRKGINGFSPIEEISYAGPDNAYPTPLDRKFCVPQTLKGMRIRPDPLPNLNDKRRDFCSRFDGYGDFCHSENIDKPLNPAPLINKTLEDHQAYNVPILVISAMSHNSLRMTLETLIMQPGIRPEIVYVAIDEKMEELVTLVDLFGFQYVKIESSFNYTEIFKKSLVKAFESSLIEQEKQNLIIIEEEIILSPDFLYFFTQVWDIYTNDPEIAAISTWNPNSYVQIDGSSSYVYRTNDFPGFAFMLKRSVYDKYIKNNFHNCCNKRAWYNWNLIDPETKKSVQLDVIVPDVSRSFRRPYDISSEDYSFLNNLLNRKRKTNLIPFPELIDKTHLAKRENYTNYLKTIIKSAVEFPDLASCFSTGNIKLPEGKNSTYKILYNQENENDLSKLKQLCKCFHLFHDDNHLPKGLYLNNILRFNSHNNNYILIGSKSTLLLNK